MAGAMAGGRRRSAHVLPVLGAGLGARVRPQGERLPAAGARRAACGGNGGRPSARRPCRRHPTHIPLQVATAEIVSAGRPRHEIQRAIKVRAGQGSGLGRRCTAAFATTAEPSPYGVLCVPLAPAPHAARPPACPPLAGQGARARDAGAAVPLPRAERGRRPALPLLHLRQQLVSLVGWLRTAGSGLPAMLAAAGGEKGCGSYAAGCRPGSLLGTAPAGVAALMPHAPPGSPPPTTATTTTATHPPATCCSTGTPWTGEGGGPAWPGPRCRRARRAACAAPPSTRAACLAPSARHMHTRTQPRPLPPLQHDRLPAGLLPAHLGGARLQPGHPGGGGSGGRGRREARRAAAQPPEPVQRAQATVGGPGRRPETNPPQPVLPLSCAFPLCPPRVQGGSGGARLTHSHERQYTYVLQSLTLWREISHEVGARGRVQAAGGAAAAGPAEHPAAATASVGCLRVASQTRNPAPRSPPDRPPAPPRHRAATDVQALVLRRRRPAAGGGALPPAEHGAGPEPRAGRARGCAGSGARAGQGAARAQYRRGWRRFDQFYYTSNSARAGVELQQHRAPPSLPSLPPPAVGRAMQQILARCQRRLGGWVGSSVVHLGDHNVPNGGRAARARAGCRLP